MAQKMLQSKVLKKVTEAVLSDYGDFRGSNKAVIEESFNYALELGLKSELALGQYVASCFLHGAIIEQEVLINQYQFDDPITRWLKNGFWGTTEKYLFWDNINRVKDIKEEVNHGGSIYDEQTAALIEESLIKEYDFDRFFQREMQEFNELIYWPQKEEPPAQIRGTRTVGLWPFNRETRMLDTNSNTEVIRFRLPNFVDGVSEFDVTIIAQVSAQFKANNRYQYDHKDVTQEFYQNLKVLDEQNGILESQITLNNINNQNNSRLDDMYWKIDRIYCKPGWTYRPNSQLILPVGYYKNWTDSGYEFEEEGGQKILTLWGI